MTNKDEDKSINFSRITNFFNRKRKQKVDPAKEIKENEDDASLDFNKTKEFLKKYVVFLLILIPIFLSIFFRSYSAYLPITDEWAENTLHNNIKSNILNQINQQYPNLPDANKQRLVNEQFNQFLKENKGSINEEVKKISANFKSRFQDDSGQTYLLAIDPYYYWRHVDHYLKRGQAGTIYTSKLPDIETQKLMYPETDFSKNIDWDGQRMAPIGSTSTMTFHAYFGVFLHKFLSIFNKNQSTLASMFLIPIIISALAVIPAFLIGRRLAGNLGGFIAGMIIAINSSFLGRTAGGFSDTDAYNVFFPLLITWLFIEALTQKSDKKRIIYASLAGLSIGLFSFAWGGWWYIFDFMLVGIGIYTFYLIIKHIIQKKKILHIIKEKEFQDYITATIFFILSSAIFTSIFTSSKTFLSSIISPFNFMLIKSVAITTLWPTIQTTVAELNPASFGQVVSSVGGKLFFWLAILGIILNFIVKGKDRKAHIKIGILLTLWFIGTIYASTKGIRFILLLVPAFAIAFGTSIGIIYKKVSDWISNALKVNKNISKIVILLLLLLLLLAPIKAAKETAKREVPSMNDAWYNTLTKIKMETAKDSIVNSWWDFGHWFITLADRRVTFDGAGQDRYMAHWVGKSLLVDDEKETVSILRMVDCGNNNAFWTLNKRLNNTVETINMLNKIILLNKVQAKSELVKYISEENTELVLKNTHCIPPDNYYITSEDMVGKAGVWAHFGSWDFNRALMYQSVKKINSLDGIMLLKNKFNLSQETASEYYYQIQTTDADRWISPWPNYASGLGSCQNQNGTLICNNNAGGQGIQFKVKLDTMETTIPTNQGDINPHSIVYSTNTSIIEKRFNNSQFPYSVALIPYDGNFRNIIMAPQLAASTFTKLFFFEGHGQECFDLFHYEQQITGGKIYTWKVNWDCNQ